MKLLISNFVLLTSLFTCFVAEIKAYYDVNMPGNFKNPQAVSEVLSGNRKTANAAWWGFEPNDSTFALQSAINSGATKVIVPYMGNDWIVRPILLQSNQEIYIEPGVNIVAKKGYFKKTGDCLFNAINKKNILLQGYGTTLKMQKTDYANTEQYEKSEWRMGIRLLSCEAVNIKGITVKDTGGDGLYIGESDSGKSCKNIFIENCIFDNNYRQGISIISAEKLRISNCIFNNTSGTNPSAGIDIEPNNNKNKLSDIVIQDCISKNNAGAGFVVSLKQLDANSENVSILFYNCYIEGCKWGLVVSSEDKDSPKGLVEFRNCCIENSISPGIWISIDKREFNTVFSNCTLRNCAQDYSFDKMRNSPVRVRGGRSGKNDSVGAIVFSNLYIFDNTDRPKLFCYFWPGSSEGKNENVSGNIFYNSEQKEKIIDTNIRIGLRTKIIDYNPKIHKVEMVDK